MSMYPLNSKLNNPAPASGAPDKHSAVNPAVEEAMNGDMESDESFDEQVEEAIANAAEEQLDTSIEVTTEILQGRKRRIAAQAIIPFELEQLWQILTDYDHLADFIPSLESSRRIDHPDDGTRIEQIGSQRLLKFNFCARVILDMFETFPYRIDFKMVEGDFKEFYGAWTLHPTNEGDTPNTLLAYTLDVLPARIMPVSLIEKKLSHNLKVNFMSIHQQAEALFG